jgi:hypothetical protein
MKMKVFVVMAAAMSAVMLAGAGAAGASAGQAVPGRWRIVKTVYSTNMPQFLSMAVTSTRSAWAFAQTTGKPAAWRLQGGVWRQVPFPGRAGEQVLAAGASAADNVWAFGSLPQGSGRALRWNGTRWAVARQFSKVIGSGLVLAPRDVWVFGEPYVPGNGLGTWHYNGRSWTRFPSVGAMTTASALSPASIWAVGEKAAAHWNGSRWSLTSLASLLPRDTPLCHGIATAVYAASASDVWVAGMGACQNRGRGPFVLLHFDGTTWRRVLLTYRYGQPYQVVPDGSGGLWIPVITGFTPPIFTMLHYSGGHLRQVPLPLPGSDMRMTVAHVPGSAVTFGAGTNYLGGMPREALIFEHGG